VGAFADVTDILPIARRHLDDLSRDLDGLSSTGLLSPPASLANRERDLIARAALFLWPRKNVARQQQDRCVVVEWLPGVSSDLCHRVAKRRKRFPRNFQTQNVALGAGFHGVRGPTSRLVARYQPLDVASGLVSGGLEPVVLGQGCRHASELARRREGDSSFAELVRHARQVL
jgi:hypothetical protein